ncbi:MAG: hypothetical protein J5981_03290 [Lachnospira sp.]|nr:hypothetical protein [Lachnospira sp.]
MKQMKRFAAAALVLVLAMSLIACGSKKSIVGSWTMEGSESVSSLEFKDDGTGTIGVGEGINLNITYTTEKDKLTMITTYMGQTETEEYTYSIKNGKLILESDGVEITYVKK